MKLLFTSLDCYYRSSNLLSYITPLLDLGLRLYIANIFFKSGLTKIKTWDSTLYLFREEYQVPILPPEFAAYLATGAELILPVLLVIGLFGRFAALSLSILNIVAVYSYYNELSEAGISQHLYWGMLLAVLTIYGMKKWSADTWLETSFATTLSRPSKPLTFKD